LLCLVTLSVSYMLFSTAGADYGRGASEYRPGVIGEEHGHAVGGAGGGYGAGSGLSDPGAAPSRWSFWPYSSSSSSSTASKAAAAAQQACAASKGFWEGLKTYGTTPPGALGTGGEAAPELGYGEDWAHGQKGAGADADAGEDEFEYSGALGRLGMEAWKGDKTRLVTRLVGHQPGWTVMEQAYVYNGSLYIVT
jgi:hypothetical protein